MGDEAVDVIDAKYISALSTIMVATIQDAKDRISQIEHIFCSQLFPKFQSKSKSLDKVSSEARLAACDAWKEREKKLLSKIEELKFENEQIQSDNYELIMSNQKLSQQLSKSASMPLKQTSLQDYNDHLRKELKNKSKEIDDARELFCRLNELLQVKGFDEVTEDGINMILSEVKSLMAKAGSLQEELSKKTLVIENLLKKLEYLSTEATNSERKLSSVEEEKQRLTTRLQVFEENVGRLEELLRQKTDKLEEGTTALEVLQGKLNFTEREMLECKLKIADHENEKTVIMGKAKDNMPMQVKHENYLAELEALRCQNEEKSWELAMEIKRRNKHVNAYKRLKSQYMFLLEKSGLTADSVLQQSRIENEDNQMEQDEKPTISGCKY